MFISFIINLFNHIYKLYMIMQYCISKCIDINVSAYYNKNIKMYHILTHKKRRK